MKQFSFLMTLMIFGLLSGKAALTAEQIDSLTNAAEAGNVRAMYELGTAYKNADGVQYSTNECLKWWTKAAEAGDASSQFALAQFYIENGFDVTDRKNMMAIKWAKAAADNGIIRALYLYGYLIEYSRPEEGLQCMIRAADLGDVRAQAEMATRYFRGDYDLVPQDYSKAFSYAKPAAEVGNHQAIQILCNCYNEGLGVMQNYEESFKWAKKAVEAGNRDFYCYLTGWYYENGIEGVVTPDLKKAVEYYRMGAGKTERLLDSNCCEALDRLGYSY